LRPPPAAERDRQLDQDRAAAAGAHPPRPARAGGAPAARRPVDERHHRHPRAQRPRAGRRAFARASSGDESVRARARRSRAAGARDHPGEPGLAMPPLTARQRAALTVALSLAVFMNVLDLSIANVAIPDIAGALGTSADQCTWVITSFAVSTAIAMPLTGWLARRFGEVRVFLACTTMFTLASLLCGLAPNLTTLIAMRTLQGAVAGPMIPLSQALLLNNYPDERKPLALALLVMVTVVAPVLGPVLGGWITDNWDWAWIFYINVPIGILATVLTATLLRGRETATARVP